MIIIMVGRWPDGPPADGHGILLNPRPASRCAFTARDPDADGWSYDDGLCWRPGEFHAATTVEWRFSGTMVERVPLCAERAAHAVACPYCASGVDRVTPVT